MNLLWSIAPVLAVLLASCQWAASDEIAFKNRLARGTLTLKCDGPTQRSWGSSITLIPTDSVSISIPSPLPPGHKPPVCIGHFLWSGEVFGFQAYSYPRDHRRCHTKCAIEARRDGLFAKNEATGGWDLIFRYPIYPLRV